MMNVNLLRMLLNDQYFNQGTITVKPRDFVFNKGHIVDVTLTPYTLKLRKCIVPVKPRELNDTGLGQYGMAENFWVYTLAALRFQNGVDVQKGDIINYKNKDYQIIAQLDFSTHGFYGQLITSLLQGTLNE